MRDENVAIESWERARLSRKKKQRSSGKRSPVLSDSQRRLPRPTLASRLDDLEQEAAKRVYRAGEVDA